MSLIVTDDDKRRLLQLARSVIEAEVEGGERPASPAGGSEALDAKAGVFVSLHLAGALRGCIGFTDPKAGVADGVMKSAWNSAFRDSRFSPVSAGEVDNLEIEISILTPPSPIESYDQINIGKHGIILEKSGCKALFLPQVPGEYGWDLPTTLTHLARKAGLPSDGWKQGARFQVFESIVFSESDFK